MTAGPAAYPGGRDETAQRLHVLYERKRYQQMRAGNWAAFTATAPVREHLEVLREAGMTQGDISRQSGVSITARAGPSGTVVAWTTTSRSRSPGVRVLRRPRPKRRQHIQGAEAVGHRGEPVRRRSANVDLVHQMRTPGSSPARRSRATRSLPRSSSSRPWPAPSKERQRRTCGTANASCEWTRSTGRGR